MKLPMKSICFIGIVLSLGLAGCSRDEPRTFATPNESASLAGQLPTNPLQWKLVTSMVDRADSTMSTLYGNDIAVEYARTHAEHDYPPGSMLALVTWTQQEDPRWFGAKIPEAPKSVEFVTVGSAVDSRPSYSYVRYEGAPLKPASAQDPAAVNERAAYLISQRAAVLP